MGRLNHGRTQRPDAPASADQTAWKSWSISSLTHRGPGNNWVLAGSATPTTVEPPRRAASPASVTTVNPINNHAKRRVDEPPTGTNDSPLCSVLMRRSQHRPTWSRRAMCSTSCSAIRRSGWEVPQSGRWQDGGAGWLGSGAGGHNIAWSCRRPWSAIRISLQRE